MSILLLFALGIVLIVVGHVLAGAIFCGAAIALCVAAEVAS